MEGKELELAEQSSPSSTSQARQRATERVMREKRLYEASLSGSVESLNKWMQEDGLALARYVSLTCFDETPLHIVARLGHVDFAKALLDHKKDLIFELDSHGQTPLHLASANGYIDIVNMLLKLDLSPCFVRDENRMTPLHLAAMKGRIHVVEALIQAKLEGMNYKVDHDNTVLHLCVMHNLLEVLKKLVEFLSGNEDFINVGDDDGNTILHIATALKQVETIKFLLKNTTVKVNAVNKIGTTALDIIEHTPRDFSPSMYKIVGNFQKHIMSNLSP